jgi:hypothetical protein
VRWSGAGLARGPEEHVVVDVYTIYTRTRPGAPPLSASSGILDAAGRATAAVALPAGSYPVLAGRTAHHAYVALAPATGAIALASNAVPLTLAP